MLVAACRMNLQRTADLEARKTKRGQLFLAGEDDSLDQQ